LSFCPVSFVLPVPWFTASDYPFNISNFHKFAIILISLVLYLSSNNSQWPTYILRPQSLNSYGDPFATSTRTTTNKAQVQGPKTNQILHINIEWKKIEAKQWLSMA
jgi:hypothetical protein